jgi:CO/xanthine dehydrogenase FAD-binding subunit
LRATAAEDLLRGRKLSPEIIAEAAATAAACTDPSSSGQGSAKYRREMTGVWVRRVLEELAA